MKRDVIRTESLNSSFLSYEKDIETILKRLFVESYPYSDQLKRLLVINAKDCLTNMSSSIYLEELKDKNLKTLIDLDYVKLAPKIRREEHAEVKSYIIITMDNFTPNDNNPYYRDCIVNFDIICWTDYWQLDNYQIRPLKIAGIIDGLFNNTHLSGIGTFNFIGCNQLVLDEELSGYTLMYRAVHGNDDKIEVGE